MNALRIAWVAIRELIYERVFYIVLCFCIFSLGCSLLLGQLTYVDSYKLTLDFMLAGCHISMVLFSVFVGISLLQKELTTGSVSMVLSKPISRSTFLLGKYLGQLTAQAAVTAFMGIVTLMICWQFRVPPVLAISQSFLFIFLESAILSAITYFFAINASAITTAVATLSIFSIGHFQSTVAQNVNPATSMGRVWSVIKKLVPDLEVFNMKSAASYGVASSAPEVGWALLYAGLCVAVYLLAASLTFARKDILT